MQSTYDSDKRYLILNIIVIILIQFWKYLYFFRLLSEIEQNLITNTFNSSSKFMTKDKLAEEFITIKTDTMDNEEFKETRFQSVNVTATVRNVTINEDIPSFREWTKKQLEEAEKQPGLK